ncbi:alpha/beta hydrolase [Scytonema sp. UIC 10036]|uniref:exo-alpha-sialidase n=1 Tax=Scytonema sp. UIC 10036 TaxID=2304196 RepID=UPI0012DAE6C4|nr:exo-alpha-sialidase [Scytonema sp. UIC 10036]MUG93774.1 alpha/beta hydrolase [Scytonema sp. UIC 10036]
MGLGTNISIKNNSGINLKISYENVVCMFRGGDQGSNFEPISGLIPRETELPYKGGKQYLEAEASGSCAFQDSEFTMKLIEVSTAKELAKIKFKASVKTGYICDCIDYKDEQLSIDCDIISKNIEVSINNLVRNIKDYSYPYIQVEFNKAGQLIEPKLTDKVISKLNNLKEVTDLIVFIHGMNNTRKEATDIYQRYLEQIKKCKGYNHESIAVCGVIWPSAIASFSLGDDLAKLLLPIWTNFDTALLRAASLGKTGVASFLNALATKHNKLNIHLVAHSLGTVVIRGALNELAAPIKTVFFIQSPLSANPKLDYLPISDFDAKLEESQINRWVSGPIVCTYTDKDLTLKSVNVFDTMGQKGFLGLSGNYKILTLKKGKKVNYRDYGKRFVSLDCREIIDGHENYKESEVAEAHLAAIERSKLAIPLQSTPEQFALAVFNNQLYLAYKANEAANYIWVTSSSDGKNWSEAQRVPEQTTSAAPALAVFNNQLYLAFKATDAENSLCIATSSNGKNWSNGQRVPGQTTSAGPCLTVFNNQLFLAFRATDADKSLCITSSSDGKNWSNVRAEESISAGPSLAVFDKNLLLGWTGKNQSINVMQLDG